MRVRNKRTATETSGANVQSSRKKLRKTLEGVGIPSPPPPLHYTREGKRFANAIIQNSSIRTWT